LKADALAFGKAIDGANNQLVELITPLEEQLEAAEKFAERREAERKAKLKSDRETAIAPYGLDITFYNFGEMSQEAFDQILSMAKTAQEAKLAAAKKAEEERVAKEKAEAEERERIRLENERLKAEAAEREQIAAEQRAKELAEQKAREETAKAELKRRTDRHNARLAVIKPYLAPTESTPPLLYADLTDEQFNDLALARKRQYDEAVRLAEEKRKADEVARKLKEQADAEARRKRDEEERQKREAELAAKRAAAAPDKTKLAEFAKAIRALPVPQLKTAATLETTIRQQVEKFAVWVEKQAEGL
jgi:hypothetical protein